MKSMRNIRNNNNEQQQQQQQQQWKIVNNREEQKIRVRNTLARKQADRSDRQATSTKMQKVLKATSEQ